jgi:hypothetical protein
VLVIDDLDRCTSAATTVEFKKYSAMTSSSRIRKKLEHVIPFLTAGLSLPPVKTVDQKSTDRRSTEKPLRAKR